MNRVNNDAIHIQFFLVDGMPFFLQNLIIIIAIGVIIFVTNPLMGFFVFVPAPLIIFIIKKIVPQFYRLRWQRWVKNAKLNAMLADSLAGMRVVKAFGRERNEVGRFKGINEELFIAQQNERKMSIKVFPGLHWMMSLGGLFVWIIGGFDVAVGGMTYGSLIAFTVYVGMIYGPLDWMIGILEWWANCMTSAHRIFEIIDTKPDIVESPNAVSVPRFDGRIEMRNVKFEYLPNKPVLHGITLEIAAGEMIGLVGKSGAGKSTMTNLITRLYDVTEGAILIDGIDVRDLKTDDLRSQIGMVLQSTVLFNGTISDNIAYARPNASKDEIIAASKLANCHDFIMKMRDGYETRVGTGFSRLSGGELQRVSIARAILINPRLLILDEATASVDTETEAQIQQALERLVKGRTTIAIAHRLSTLRNADRLVVVDKGEIKEVGTHEELELLKGKYYDMLTIQREALKIGGIIEDDVFGLATRGDIPEILSLYASLIGTPGCTWNAEYPNAETVECDLSNNWLYTLKREGKIIAAASAGKFDDWEHLQWSAENPCELARIGVLPSMHRQGIGGVMLRHIITEMKRQGFGGIRFIVSKSNEAALALYEKNGFKRCGETFVFDIDWYCLELSFNNEIITEDIK
jgi:ATP-binding cassette subfamily B protein